MRVSLTLPIYLRGNRNNRAIAATIKHYAGLGLPLHICGSEGDLSRKYCDSYLSENVKYIEVPQDRFSSNSGGGDVLRKKFNDSIATHGPGYDWYCMMGADDIVSESIFESLPSTHEPTMAGISMGNPLIVCDLERGARHAYTVNLRYKLPLRLLPGVNCFNKAAMELCKWEPYQRNGCETGAEMLFREFGNVLPLPGWVVMLKEGNVLNKTQHIKRHHPTKPATREQIALIQRFV